MFEGLSDRLSGILSGLTRRGALTEADVTAALREVRRALLEAGVALAREGGPEAVTLREATRRAGVAPNAAYRHFASQQALLLAVRATALSEVAQAMEGELAALPAKLSPADRARASVRAVGTVDEIRHTKDPIVRQFIEGRATIGASSAHTPEGAGVP